ncbi:tetraacyldisaccharide 4'-kinase [Aggregatimonas sangjinii]|nr:tetraacyldisaccharide 4'-kinase [Aggregatimonas sangjinii]
MLLRKILFPFSLLYALVVRVRNYLYDTDIWESMVFQTKVICIGNLSVGGTGKTPMVEYLLSQLQPHFKIAVLSRGYKRKSQGFLLANSDSTVAELGDEPFQIHRKFPKVKVAVDADRRNGIAILEKDVQPDLIVLDDAFQHRKVKAGLNILLTAYGKLYSEDWYLPTGNLRDSRSAARRADLIVVTKCPSELSEMEIVGIRERLKPRSNQKLLFATLHYADEFPGDDQAKKLDFFMNKNVTLVTGIADPTPLTDYLKAKTLQFEHLKYTDHHSFTAAELKLLNEKEIVLTTEKDYVRLKNKVNNLYYIPVAHQFLGNDATILTSELKDFMKRYA